MNCSCRLYILSQKLLHSLKNFVFWENENLNQVLSALSTLHHRPVFNKEQFSVQSTLFKTSKLSCTWKYWFSYFYQIVITKLWLTKDSVLKSLFLTNHPITTLLKLETKLSWADVAAWLLFPRSTWHKILTYIISPPVGGEYLLFTPFFFLLFFPCSVNLNVLYTDINPPFPFL